MRKVNKNFQIRPISLLPTGAAYINALQIVQTDGRWTDRSTKLYSADSIQRALEAIYHGKCAYCELRPMGSPPQVEHFRPKNGVATIQHTGYYWLAYEWSNLLLACANCNSRKGNHFPIRHIANRVLVPTLENGVISESSNFISNTPLRLEGCMLLNPEIDYPENHLIYSSKGKLLDLTDRGKISIDRYDLNREELYLNGRKKIIDELYQKLFRRLNRYVTGKRNASLVIEDILDVIKEDIVRPIVEEHAYTAFLKNVLLHFEQFVINRFPEPKIRLILRRAYSQLIQ